MVTRKLCEIKEVIEYKMCDVYPRGSEDLKGLQNA